MRTAALLSACLLAGCAALMNSGRPSYGGPVAAPLWHADGFAVTADPLIADGVVFAVAEPLDNSDYDHPAAFDARTGKRLWLSSERAEKIVAVLGGSVIVADGSGTLRAISRATGSASFAFDPASDAKATVSGSTLYRAANGSIAAFDSRGRRLWNFTTPFKPWVAPVVSGSTLYALGFVPPANELDNQPSLLYALDAASGKVRWKVAFRDRPGIGGHRPYGVVADAGGAYVIDLLSHHSLTDATAVLAYDAANGHERWSRILSGSCPFDPALIAPSAVLACAGPSSPAGAGNVVRALARANGAELWRAETDWTYVKMLTAGTELIAVDRRVDTVLNENGTNSYDAWLTRVDLRTGKPVWRGETLALADLSFPAMSGHLAVAGSKPFRFNDVRGDDAVAGLWAYDLGAR